MSRVSFNSSKIAAVGSTDTDEIVIFKNSDQAMSYIIDEAIKAGTNLNILDMIDLLENGESVVLPSREELSLRYVTIGPISDTVKDYREKIKTEEILL